MPDYKVLIGEYKEQNLYSMIKKSRKELLTPVSFPNSKKSILNSYYYKKRITITVMTYNIRRESDPFIEYQRFGEDKWGNDNEHFRNSRVLEILVKYFPDIICLQEVKSGQFEYIKSRINKNYNFVKGRKNIHGEYEPIFYRNDKFTIVGSGSVNVGENFNNKNYNRVCSFIELKDLSEKKAFWIFNTHLLSGNGDFEIHHREQSVMDIRRLFGTEGVSGIDGHPGLELNASSRIILAGDFNSKKSMRLDYGIKFISRPFPPDNEFMCNTPYRLITKKEMNFSYSYELVDSFLVINNEFDNLNNLNKYDTTHPDRDWNFICVKKWNYAPGEKDCDNWDVSQSDDDERIDFIFHSLNLKTTASRIITDNYWFTPGVDMGADNNFDGVNRASDHDPVLSSIELVE